MHTTNGQVKRYGESFGEITRMYRKESLRESVREFAPKVGMSFGHWSAIERGEVEPTRELVEKTAQVLDIDLDSLLGSAGMIRKELGVANLRFPRAAVTFLQLLLAVPYESANRLDSKIARARKKFIKGKGGVIDNEAVEALKMILSEALKQM